MTLPVTIDLSQPFSGNTVMRWDDKVLKTGERVHYEYEWYQSYQDVKDIPHCLNGEPSDRLWLEFIDSVGKFDISDVSAIVAIVEKYKDYQPMNNFGFDEYRQRIAIHLGGNPIHGGDKLLFKLQQAHLWPTFCHGDLSVRNIIKSKDGLKLIDPLYGKDRFGSYMLDYAKLLFTLKFFDNNTSAFNELMTMTQLPPVFIASECVRVATYNKRFNFIAENLIFEL